MDPTDRTLAPVWAILATFAAAVVLYLLTRLIPKRRDIEPEDISEPLPMADPLAEPLPPAPEAPALPAPRAVMPTQDDIEPPAAEPPARGLAALDAPAACRVCDEPLTADERIEHEDWAQVQSGWGRFLARLGMRLAMAPGRELFAARGLCRSCAAIGDHEDRAFEVRIALLIDAKRRLWERRGRDDAIRRCVHNEAQAYEDELAELRRSDTRARLRDRID